ncbi:MAG: hypothetical protein CMJ68_10900 [Planctomycetaceae bacterium]|nr:hypothetical protein [Planctomycetaceae bacterium]
MPLGNVDRPSAEFMDHTDKLSLVTPGLVHDRRGQRHSRQPRAGCAGRTVAETAGPDEPFWPFVPVAANSTYQ